MQNYLKYTVNLDLTRYEDGERSTENPEGRVHPNIMWAMHKVRPGRGMAGDGHQ